MAASKNLLPDCGLYRTSKPLPGNETNIPAGLLVYFHNHSDSGLPQVLAPDHNIHNRWHFHGPGIEFRALSWADSLVKMPTQGFYSLRRELTFEGGSWPKGALLQLGYTRNAEPILFIAQERGQLMENDLFFSDRGVKITNEQLSMLEQLSIFVEQGGGHTAGDTGLADVFRQTPLMRARDILGPDGPLARRLPGYEARAAQLTMADAVERALTEDRKLVCEAGTGTGKTLAYLVPAILSGRKVVISTATKALQEQIFTKDIPLLAEHSGLKADVALVKGLGNYLCRRRYTELRRSAEASRPGIASSLAIVERWLGETEMGDLAELVSIPESDPIRAEIGSSSETRIGSACTFHDECFVTQMKREAERARILVVNHHLFFADLALRGDHEGGALPAYDAVIFDEAHQIEDVATDFFGVRVSSARVDSFLRDAERAFVSAGIANILALARSEGAIVLTALRSASNDFFLSLRSSAASEIGRQPFDPKSWTELETAAYHRFDAAIEAVGALAKSKSSLEAIDMIARRAEQLRDDLAEILDGKGRRVTWLEPTARGVGIGASPVNVSGSLHAKLFETVPAIVLTSATLTTSTGFSFLRSRVGLTDDVGPVDELSVPSPFDYARNALLYVARDLPEVQDPAFFEQAGERAAELVRASKGGAFVLCTSIRAMRAFHAALRARGIKPLLLQGDAPKSSLLAKFRAAQDQVLVATMSFWEGVDVPGHALRLVIIDKCPFPVPSDALVAARSTALEEAGINPFIGYHVPTAAISLKQGFGRLIRTSTDRGVVAILDKRVVTRGYGKQLLAALPPASRTERIEDVGHFFDLAR